jgi:recombination protein RecA
MGLLKRKNAVESVVKATEETSVDLTLISRKVNVDQVISTGSTLLDLAISGKRRYGGGMPGGIVVEIFGPSGVGKTALLAELCASAQTKGGDVQFNDPEARLDMEYSRIYGMELNKKNYDQPRTVLEVFKNIRKWKPSGEEGAIHVSANDSLAALSTDLEMDNDEGDKRGQRRAKEFSEGFRKTIGTVAANNWLIVCSNQIRQGEYGVTTPGGEAIKFYSSTRIEIKPAKSSKIEKTTKVDIEGTAKEVSKIIGIRSMCKVVKSSVDEPYREAPISILFGYGLDDVRENLQYVKDMTGSTKYNCITKEYQSMENAIRHIEENKLELKLKNKVIGIWEKIESAFDTNRKKKDR